VKRIFESFASEVGTVASLATSHSIIVEAYAAVAAVSTTIAASSASISVVATVGIKDCRAATLARRASEYFNVPKATREAN
jgi:hypothetical protein